MVCRLWTCLSRFSGCVRGWGRSGFISRSQTLHEMSAYAIETIARVDSLVPNVYSDVVQAWYTFSLESREASLLLAVRIMYASDDSCGGGLGTRLGCGHIRSMREGERPRGRALAVTIDLFSFTIHVDVVTFNYPHSLLFMCRLHIYYIVAVLWQFQDLTTYSYTFFRNF